MPNYKSPVKMLAVIELELTVREGTVELSDQMLNAIVSEYFEEKTLTVNLAGNAVYHSDFHGGSATVLSSRVLNSGTEDALRHLYPREEAEPKEREEPKGPKPSREEALLLLGADVPAGLGADTSCMIHPVTVQTGDMPDGSNTDEWNAFVNQIASEPNEIFDTLQYIPSEPGVLTHKVETALPEVLWVSDDNWITLRDRETECRIPSYEIYEIFRSGKNLWDELARRTGIDRAEVKAQTYANMYKLDRKEAQIDTYAKFYGAANPASIRNTIITADDLQAGLLSAEIDALNAWKERTLRGNNIVSDPERRILATDDGTGAAEDAQAAAHVEGVQNRTPAGENRFAKTVETDAADSEVPRDPDDYREIVI